MPGSSNTAATARQQAQEILSKPPYRTTPAHTPRPLAGVFHALGRGIEWLFAPPFRWLDHHLLLHIAHGVTGVFGRWWLLAVGALAVGVGVLVAFLLIRRRTRIAASMTRAATGERDVEPDALEQAAAAAERAGDHEAAVRLRFRAGLTRLARRGVIANQDAQTGRQLALGLHSPTFDTLAHRHEVIVYGRDPATADDAAGALHDWPRVLAEVGSAGPPPPSSGAAAP
jgi:hypothetical protein